jgi:hypothetical protein
MLRRRAPRPTFQYKSPRFGRVPSPREEQHWRRSVYYWWWRYLRMNEDYRRCCERAGRGRMSRIYSDFGDVFANDFRTWWLDGERGVKLFAEPPAPVRLRELRDQGDWEEDWTHESVMVVAVPLSDSKRQLQSRFAKLLKYRHKGKPGMPTKTRSRAQLSVSTKFQVPALRKMAEVYELWRKDEGITLARIGEKLRLMPAQMPVPSDSIDTAAQKRMVMAVAVSRYLKKAKRLVENVGKNKFPCLD